MIKKLLLTTLMASSLANSQTIIANMNSGHVTSTVYQYGSSYKYEYTIDSKINNKKISTVTINLDDINVYNLTGDDEYVVTYYPDYILFEDIKPKDDYFVASYYSNNVPNMFNMSVDNTKDVYDFNVFAPIPEPSVLLLLLVGFLMNNRRR